MRLTKVKQFLRNGQYVWPGGYPLYWVMGDGGAMHYDCVKACWREVVSAQLHIKRHSNGHYGEFVCAAPEVNWEDGDLTCDHCGKRIESAYAEDDNEQGPTP